MGVFKNLIVIIIGLAVGAMSSFWMAGFFGGKDHSRFFDVDVAGWRSDWSIGTYNANAYVRARVARHGLLALAKEEAIYFIRDHDEDGNRLTQNCTYQLSGKSQESLWWSVTLYDKNSLLPINTDKALSVDKTKITAAGHSEGDWRAIIATEKPAGNAHWISSRNAGQFDVMLRLYKPSQNVLRDPVAYLAPPSVIKLSCQGGEA